MCWQTFGNAKTMTGFHRSAPIKMDIGCNRITDYTPFICLRKCCNLDRIPHNNCLPLGTPLFWPYFCLPHHSFTFGNAITLTVYLTITVYLQEHWYFDLVCIYCLPHDSFTFRNAVTLTAYLTITAYLREHWYFDLACIYCLPSFMFRNTVTTGIHFLDK